jgi:hypothetical protein
LLDRFNYLQVIYSKFPDCVIRNWAQRRPEISKTEGFEDIREKIDTQRGGGVTLMYVGEYAETLAYLAKAAALAARNRGTKYAKEAFKMLKAKPDIERTRLAL